MKTIQKIKDKTTHYGKVAAIIGMSLLPYTVKAGSLELEKTQDVTTTDVKVGGDLGKGLGYFMRSRTSADNNDNINTFVVGDITYNLGKGTQIVGEIQRAKGMGTMPRLGVETYQKVGPFDVYSIATHTLKKEDNIEALLNLSLKKTMSKDWNAIGNIEGLVGYNRNNLDRQYSLARIRTGVEKDSKQAGLSLNVSEGSKPQVGVYGKVSF